jgi:hypothetical protein
MELPTTTTTLEEDANWAVERATGLPEVWALVAKCRGVVGAWQLMRVCRASARKKKLSQHPAGARGVRRAFFGCGSERRVEAESGDDAVGAHGCSRYCAYGSCVLRGERHPRRARRTTGYNDFTSGVEMLSSALGAFEDLPPLSYSNTAGAAAIAVDESDSAAGQVLLLGGMDEDVGVLSTVYLVDLATGACAQQPDLLRSRVYPAAGSLPDGRIVYAGGIGDYDSAEVWGPPTQSPLDAAWT